jgi:hypothetical protein
VSRAIGGGGGERGKEKAGVSARAVARDFNYFDPARNFAYFAR